MNICILAASQNRHMSHWAKSLARKGHKVNYLSFGKVCLENVSSHLIEARMAGSYLRFVVNAQRVRKVLRQLNPDVLHTIYLTNYGLLAALTDFRPLVVTVAGSDLFVEPLRNRIFSLTNKYVLGRASLIHSVAHHMTEKLRKIGIGEEKILTMPEGIDVEKFPARRKEQTGHFPLLLSYRDFKPVYNLELLIKAIPHVIKVFSNLKVILIGQGPEEAKLRTLVNESQIQNNVVFEGAVPRDKIPDYLASAHVYVSTSLSDGASASLQEAMACGVFPVVTDIEANREWINDPDHGILVPTDNPETLAEKVIEVLRDKKLRENAAEKNVNMIRLNARDEDIIDRLIEGYQKIIQSVL